MIQISTIEDIAKLPWRGAHHIDVKLFRACDKFIRTLTDRGDQKKALRLMAQVGMGIDGGEVSDKELDDFLALRG